MGEQIECPGCGNRFYIHGFEEIAKCYNCNNTFNPQINKVNDA